MVRPLGVLPMAVSAIHLLGLVRFRLASCKPAPLRPTTFTASEEVDYPAVPLPHLTPASHTAVGSDRYGLRTNYDARSGGGTGQPQWPSCGKGNTTLPTEPTNMDQRAR